MIVRSMPCEMRCITAIALNVIHLQFRQVNAALQPLLVHSAHAVIQRDLRWVAPNRGGSEVDYRTGNIAEYERTLTIRTVQEVLTLSLLI